MSPKVAVGKTREELVEFIAGCWSIQESALQEVLEESDLPAIEQAHQSYVAGFLSGLVLAGKIDLQEMEQISLTLFERRDAELAEGAS